MRPAPRLAILTALLPLALACGSTNGDSTAPTDVDPHNTRALSTALEPAEIDGPILIGAVASLSGSGAPYGNGQAQGIELAVRHAQGTGADLDLELRDDESSSEGGVAAFEELIEARASVILGPTLSPVAVEAAPIAQSVGVPVLAVTNTTLDIEAIGDMVWRVSLSEEEMLPQTLAVASEEHDLSSAALVWDGEDDYAAGAARAFRAAAAENDIELVADVRFDPDETEGTEGGYANVLSEATEDDPDALLFAARSTPATELLLVGRELGVTATLVGGNGFNSAAVIEDAGAAADGLLVAASWNPEIDEPASRAFVEEFSSHFDLAPDAFAAQSYAGVQILLAALEGTEDPSRQEIQDGLAALDGVSTVLGDVRFEEHEAVYPAAVQEVRDGTFHLLARGTP